jgi:tyrosyl-tRNA synthetase
MKPSAPRAFIQREYGQEAQVAVITPLLEGTDGVQKMSKSLGNYIGINEPPGEMFGKVMSVSDELMWRYYELCTNLRPNEIASLRRAAGRGERNPRDLKAELAERIIADFHSPDAARAALEDFNRVFQRKEAPEDIEERPVPAGTWRLPRLLVDAALAPSMGEARRLIEQGGVRLDGEKITRVDYELDLVGEKSVLLQVGKRRFLRLRAS